MNVLSNSNLNSVSIYLAGVNAVILMSLLVTLNISSILFNVFIVHFEYMSHYEIYLWGGSLGLNFDKREERVTKIWTIFGNGTR